VDGIPVRIFAAAGNLHFNCYGLLPGGSAEEVFSWLVLHAVKALDFAVEGVRRALAFPPDCEDVSDFHAAAASRFFWLTALADGSGCELEGIGVVTVSAVSDKMLVAEDAGLEAHFKRAVVAFVIHPAAGASTAAGFDESRESLDVSSAESAGLDVEGYASRPDVSAQRLVLFCVHAFIVV
jgi:hypothetical protein